jgi:hypothetical protein
MARKTLALATALSLVSFGFAGIGTGAALSAPTASPEGSSLNSTKVIKLANGKTRIKVDLADNLRGKTIILKTTRMVNGKREKVTLGKIKLTKTGQGKLTVSRKIRVDDTLVVSDGVTNIVRSKVQVIDDRRTPSTPAPVPPPPSGGGSGVAATFNVTVRDVEGIKTVEFEGTASGDVTVTIRETPDLPDTVVFTRSGIEAQNTVNIIDQNSTWDIISNPGTANALVMSARVFLTVGFANPFHRVKIAGTADAFDLVAVSDAWGSQLDATLVTEITGDLAELGDLSLEQRSLQEGDINRIVFGSHAVRIDDLNQLDKTNWLVDDQTTFGGAVFGTWAFDSTLGVVLIWDGSAVFGGADVSGLGTILSVTGMPAT